MTKTKKEIEREIERQEELRDTYEENTEEWFYHNKKFLLEWGKLEGYEKGKQEAQEEVLEKIEKCKMSERDAKILINSENIKVKDEWIIVRNLLSEISQIQNQGKEKK